MHLLLSRFKYRIRGRVSCIGPRRWSSEDVDRIEFNLVELDCLDSFQRIEVLHDGVDYPLVDLRLVREHHFGFRRAHIDVHLGRLDT